MNFAAEIASSVRSGSVSAAAVVEAALGRIEEFDGTLNCFTAVTRERALQEAAAVDDAVRRGENPGVLAGVPYAVKNLFDVVGLPTLAGSKLRASAAPASGDATAIRRLHDAGAVLLGALNMDEFAYGFTTENTHYGPTRNPHDVARVAGGSSGGSGAAVAGGLVPLTLGSDTNGSIRVPASFCGVFGLKPTYGRLSRAGAFLFVNSLDHVGPLARSVEDLALAFDVMQGPDAADPVCTARPVQTSFETLLRGAAGLRIAVAGGYFATGGDPHAFEAVAHVAGSLGVSETVEILEAGRARAAAFVITASEGGLHHLADLRERAADFDPMTRSRFLAGTLVPAAWVDFAQRFRTWFRDRMHELFAKVDVLIAPASPCPAIRIGQNTIVLDGKEAPSRPNIGVFTQPISFIGLPVVAVPVHLPGKLPIGVQLIGAPYSEANLLRTAWQLQQSGTATAPIAAAYRNRNNAVEAIR